MCQDVMNTDVTATLDNVEISLFVMRCQILTSVLNSDLTSEYYTVEITSAYDYTTHQNQLPINNNTYTFKVKTSLPDMPINPENSVDIIPVRNYEMGINKRINIWKAL